MAVSCSDEHMSIEMRIVHVARILLHGLLSMRDEFEVLATPTTSSNSKWIQ